MKVKNDRLEALRMIISSQELGSQDELLDALKKEGMETDKTDVLGDYILSPFIVTLEKGDGDTVEIARNLSPLKRTDHSYNHYIYELLPYFSNWYQDHSPHTRLIEWTTPAYDLAAIIADPDCGILCINDNDAVTDWKERAAIVREAIGGKLKN
jgi:hypothetical protein